MHSEGKHGLYAPYLNLNKDQLASAADSSGGSASDADVPKMHMYLQRRHTTYINQAYMKGKQGLYEQGPCKPYIFIYGPTRPM